MRSEYNLTGNVVEEIKKKHAFVWRIKDQLYAVYQNECKRVTEDSQLFYRYNEYVKSEKGTSFGLIKTHASAYLSGNTAITEATDVVFSELDAVCDDDLNSQLTNYVFAYSNAKGESPPLTLGGHKNQE